MIVESKPLMITSQLSVLQQKTHNFKMKTFVLNERITLRKVHSNNFYFKLRIVKKIKLEGSYHSAVTRYRKMATAV